MTKAPTVERPVSFARPVPIAVPNSADPLISPFKIATVPTVHDPVSAARAPIPVPQTELATVIRPHSITILLTVETDEITEYLVPIPAPVCDDA
jgi:hypothetical protein